jgi:hypothetical protein
MPFALAIATVFSMIRFTHPAKKKAKYKVKVEILHFPCLAPRLGDGSRTGSDEIGVPNALKLFEFYIDRIVL